MTPFGILSVPPSFFGFTLMWVLIPLTLPLSRALHLNVSPCWQLFISAAEHPRVKATADSSCYIRAIFHNFQFSPFGYFQFFSQLKTMCKWSHYWLQNRKQYLSCLKGMLYVSTTKLRSQFRFRTPLYLSVPSVEIMECCTVSAYCYFFSAKNVFLSPSFLCNIMLAELNPQTTWRQHIFQMPLFSISCFSIDFRRVNQICINLAWQVLYLYVLVLCFF